MMHNGCLAKRLGDAAFSALLDKCRAILGPDDFTTITSSSVGKHLAEPDYSLRLEYFHTQLGSGALVRLLCGRSSPTVLPSCALAPS